MEHAAKNPGEQTVSNANADRWESSLMKKISFNKIVLSLIGLFTSISPFAADFNKTHVYNPEWPPHARFHNGQTMTLGLICGALSLYFLWFRKRESELENLTIGSLFSALYWLAMAPAILYPGADFVDPGHGGNRAFLIGSFQFTQLHMDFVLFAVVWLCFRAEKRRIQQRAMTSA
jgi:H+/Cl- antiporter ClcA